MLFTMLWIPVDWGYTDMGQIVSDSFGEKIQNKFSLQDSAFALDVLALVR